MDAISNIRTNRHRTILGVDPDIEKSGFALLDCESRTFEQLSALSFTDITSYLSRMAANEKYKNTLIVIEDSDTSTNWHCGSIIYDKHLTIEQKVRKAAAIGRSAGLCHATYRHLKEYAEALGFQVKGKKPLVKMWKGPDGKITHDELKVFVSGLPKRTNQECRDSALLAWDEANFPIRISVRK